ncbi:unnamed protein product, partial [Discosporangium mesarthrocarpum]
VFCYNGAIEAAGRAGDTKQGMGLLEEMSRRGIKPDTTSFRPLLNACARTGNQNLANELTDLMKQLGLRAERGQRSM